MRVLAISALAAEKSDLPAVVAAVKAAGHDCRSLTFERTGPGPAREAALAALIAKEALLRRPKVAILEMSPDASATAATLQKSRISYVLWVNAAGLSAPEAVNPVRSAASGFVARNAAAVIVACDDVANQLAQQTGVADMELLGTGVDLSLLPLGNREEAKAALRLPPDMKVLGLIGELKDSTGLESLTFAHRRMAGVALLVAGDGPQAKAIYAMGASTRPSSPVIHVGPLAPATRVLTGCAADVGLALDRFVLSDESWQLAALGRRQVTFEVDGTDAVAATYPAHRTVFCAPEDPEVLRQALTAALDEEATAGPLPTEAVEQARSQLDGSTQWQRLAERVFECA